jgi:hypothetical protein
MQGSAPARTSGFAAGSGADPFCAFAGFNGSSSSGGDRGGFQPRTPIHDVIDTVHATTVSTCSTRLRTGRNGNRRKQTVLRTLLCPGNFLNSDDVVTDSIGQPGEDRSRLIPGPGRHEVAAAVIEVVWSLSFSG